MRTRRTVLTKVPQYCGFQTRSLSVPRGPFRWIPESNPYDVLLSIFGKIGTPFFKTLVKDSGRGERDGDKLALSVEKNLSEVSFDP
uniref:Uncharacterized protein n=1 Tax=Parascaris equorum TaxID=6256 RepID=A0A914S722_PAREQ